MKNVLLSCMLLSLVGFGCTVSTPTPDACDGVTCNEGETCMDGQCVADDPCADVMCNEGETCMDGQCVADDPCADVTCNEGESCVDGQCVADAVGNVEAGMTLVADNCSACHGADGASGFAPDIQGVTSETIGLKTGGQDGHLTVELTEQEIADLAAYLGSF